MKKVYFISKQASDYLYSDSFKQQLNLINIGVHAFQRNNSKFNGTECIYRIVQDGVINILPYMTKRVVRSRNLSVFKQLIMKRYNGSQSLGDRGMHDELAKLTAGCFVFVYEMYEGDKLVAVEPLTMHKFEFALSTMISKENCLSL